MLLIRYLLFLSAANSNRAQLTIVISDVQTEQSLCRSKSKSK